MRAADVAAPVLEAFRGGAPVVEVLVVRGPYAGARALVAEDGLRGSLGSPELDARALVIGRAAIRNGGTATESIAAGGQEHLLYVEAHRPPGELVIVGAGHIAQPLARIGAALGFVVTVLDDRPDFATRERFPDADRVIRADLRDPLAAVRITPRTHLVLVTRGHKHDYDVLVEIMKEGSRPAYVGMVGSRRRVRATFEQLAREGVPVEALAEIHAPIGLDLGAETPEEIAVSIAAELVLVGRGGTGVPLRDRERVVRRWIERVD
jgi:xanthine dehydrogenase accessory factor